jgi:hypothetical protein
LHSRSGGQALPRRARSPRGHFQVRILQFDANRAASPERPCKHQARLKSNRHARGSICSFTSPASRRAISAASPTSRFSRSHSSLMMLSSSSRWLAVQPGRGKQRGHGSLHGSERGAEIVRNRIQQSRLEAFAFASRFGLPHHFDGVRPLDGHGDQRAQASRDCRDSTGPEIPTLPRIACPAEAERSRRCARRRSADLRARRSLSKNPHRAAADSCPSGIFLLIDKK